MTEQLSLAGLGGVAKPTDRLFFGLIADSASAGQIEEMARSLRVRHGLTGHLIPASRLHVTLCHIGDYEGLPKHFVEQAKEIGEKIKLPPFDVLFDRAMSFQHSKAYVLRAADGNAALHELRLELFKALKTYGPGCLDGPTFTPHLTLLYDKQIVAEHPVEPVRLKVREFFLVHSLLGKSTYVFLARWPLAG